MATTTRRSKSANIAPSVVIQAEAFLNDLPAKPKEQLSLREAVGQLQEQIQEALAKGYSYQDVADMLAQQGIMISASTLKNYVPSGKRRSTKEIAPKVTRRKLKVATPEVEEVAPATPEVVAPTPARRGRKSTAPTATKTPRGRRPKSV
jgi:IS30 family transposase